MGPESIIVGGVVCFGAVVVLMVTMVVVAVRREKARRGTLQRWAMEHGWVVTLRPAVDWGQRMPGRNRRGVTLALSGVVGGRSVTIAEYHYESSSSSDSSSTTYRYVLTVVRLSRPGPTISVSRRGAMSQLGRSVFGDRASAIGHEPFDRAYRVAADDPQLVRRVLGPSLVAEHLAGRLPDWSLKHNELLTYRTGLVGEPHSIPTQFAPLLRVADLMEADARW